MYEPKNKFSDYTDEDLLLELVNRNVMLEAPKKTERFVPHYEVIVGIGNNDSASIILPAKSFEVLCDLVYQPVSKEKKFKDILEKALKGIENFKYQHEVLDFRVDFFFPDIGLIVEYDEVEHLSNKLEDKERQDKIEKQKRYEFIRVAEGKEIEGLNSILLYILDY